MNKDYDSNEMEDNQYIDSDEVKRRVDAEPPKPKKICGACGKRIFPSRWLCEDCEIEFGVRDLPYKDWPDIVKDYANQQRNATRADAKYDENTLEIDDIPAWVSGDYDATGQQLYKDWQQSLFNEHLSLAEVLIKYGISKLDYDILTESNLMLLAEHTGEDYEKIKKRRQRLKERLGNSRATGDIGKMTGLEAILASLG